MSNLNISITPIEIKAITKVLPTKLRARQFSTLPHFQIQVIANTLQIINKIKAEKAKLHDPLYKVAITLVPKPHKDCTKKTIKDQFHL